MTKVQLIRPPLDDWYDVGQFEDCISVPAGLCLLAEGLDDVEVLDGMYVPLEDTLARVEADVVGVTDIYPTHASALEVLKEAKKKGAVTVIGGTNVTFLAERILANNDFVDYVVVQQGEEAFNEQTLANLVLGMGLEKIPNLVYRGQRTRSEKKVPLKRLFELEKLVDWHNFRKDNFFPLSSIRGCIKAELEGRCTFCSIGTGMNVMDPDLVWDQIDILSSMYEVKRVWEGGDSFIVKNFPQRLLAARPDHLSHIQWKMFTRPDDITEEIADVLAALNSVEVFIGAESADDGLLKRANKGYTTKEVYAALDRLHARGMTVHTPFIYGLPGDRPETGESPETLEKTYQMALHITKEYPLTKVISSMPVPIPGTQLFEQLRSDERVQERYPGDIDKDDLIDYGALVRLQTEYFTSVTFEALLEYREKTKELVPAGQRTSFDINR
jgi:radical SAM superfamily enzyme YgiQ (UPF0313 family)